MTFRPEKSTSDVRELLKFYYDIMLRCVQHSMIILLNISVYILVVSSLVVSCFGGEPAGRNKKKISSISFGILLLIYQYLCIVLL